MKTALLRLTLTALLVAPIASTAATHYVDLHSSDPVAPYTNWTTAARDIQTAVDAASSSGAVVLVNDGTYLPWGVAQGNMVNGVGVNKPIQVRSVNGPEFTVILADNYPYPWTLGEDAYRCVYLTNHASLSGFTLTGGATRASGHTYYECFGGGVYCASEFEVVSNCWITGNFACSGAGAFGGTLVNCVLTNNHAIGTNLQWDFGSSTGGGAYNSRLVRCTLRDNSASVGGSDARCSLEDCLLTGNWASSHGGASWASYLRNCTVVGNASYSDGGGASECSLESCVVYYNSDADLVSCYAENSCIQSFYGLVTPSGNFSNAPLFVDTNNWVDLHLQSNSPCINAGNNAYVTTTNDLDGNPRIAGGTVDIGAYEFQSPQSAISYAWLQQYGLPTDGSVDDLDIDLDSHATWQEWRTRTDPTNGLSVLRMLSPQIETNGAVVSWESVAGQSYMLERATNPAMPFSLLQSNITGQAGATSFTDTNAAGAGPFLYRVGVK